jgi:fumarate hydratase class I
VINVQIVPGDKLDVTVAAKGGGSENKSKMIMMNPSDSLVDWVLKTVPTMGAGWCPPGMLGIGIGGTAEKAVLLAKESLMDDLDMYELQAKSRAAKSWIRWKSCAWSCTRRSTPWASARRAWAA